MKAIGLVSGGLDSMLAIKLIADQGIEVIAVHFMTPFYRGDKTTVETSLHKNIAQQMGVQLRIISLEEDFLAMLANPRYGYGSNVNPCIDCKILMLQKTKIIMEQFGASFIFTGEVLGQRPMSQNRIMLGVIEKQSGLAGFLLRPLSARLFDSTIPEQKGWIDRRKLLAVSGRSRAAQLSLVKEYGIQHYVWPAGGCLLTEPGFSNRVTDLIDYKQLTMDNVQLLKCGRQFRLSSDFRLIVGKNEKDNIALSKLAKSDDFFFEPETLAGPSALGRGILTLERKNICAGIVARYTETEKITRIKFTANGISEIISVFALDDVECKKYLI